MMLYEKINQSIEEHFDEYFDIVKKLYHNPEIGLTEFESSKILINYLKKVGFSVKSGVVSETDFVAQYESDKKGPVIAFLCEYDALPAIGHGCGHNIIAAISIAAAEAVMDIADEFGGEIRVIGTPAEENYGGKVVMAKAGIFDDVDVALMMHPSNKSGLGGESSAVCTMKFEFFGKNAHACEAQNGASSLDAAVMTYININLLRQFYQGPETFIHGIITNGGEAVNIIPDYAAMKYSFRAATLERATEISDRALECAKGASLAAGVRLEANPFQCAYSQTLVNYKLTEMLSEKFKILGIDEYKTVKEVGKGSSDVGNVSYICPTLQGAIKTSEFEVNLHTKEFADATISELGADGLIKGAKSIAYIACDLLTDSNALKAVKDEFEKNISQNT